MRARLRADEPLLDSLPSSWHGASGRCTQVEARQSRLHGLAPQRVIVLLHRSQIALSRDRGRAGENELAVGSNSVVFHQGTLREVLRGREEHLEELVAQLVGRFPQVDRRRRALPVDRADRLGQRLDRVLIDAYVVDNVDVVKLLIQLTDAEAD